MFPYWQTWPQGVGLASPVDPPFYDLVAQSSLEDGDEPEARERWGRWQEAEAAGVRCFLSQ